MDGRTTARAWPSYKLTLRAFGSGELKTGYFCRKTLKGTDSTSVASKGKFGQKQEEIFAEREDTEGTESTSVTSKGKFGHKQEIFDEGEDTEGTDSTSVTSKGHNQERIFAEETDTEGTTATAKKGGEFCPSF